MPYKDPEQKREYAARWAKETRERRRTDWFSENGPCSCGSWADLELDHIDPATKVAHEIWTWGDVRREAELAKCQVLCHDCHSAKSSGEGPKGERNGTAVLNRVQVQEIRGRCRNERQIDLAAEYGVDKSTIYQIAHGKIWKQVAWP